MVLVPLQELFGGLLSLALMPEPDEVQQALAQAASSAAALPTSSFSKRQKSAASSAGSRAPLSEATLAKALPDASSEALDLIMVAAEQLK